MRGPQQAQQVHELLPVDVVPRQPQVQVLLVVRAVRPQDVEPLPAAAHPRQESLPHQQPARVDQLQPPQRMTGVHEVAARAPRPRPLRGRLQPLVMGDELLLLVRVGLPPEAGHLVVAGADAAHQLLDATGGVQDTERFLDPEADLIGVAEATGADLLLETLNLSGGEVARVAPVVKGAEGIEAAVAEPAQPLGERTHAAAEQIGNLESGLAVGDPEHGGEAFVEALVVRLVAAALEFLALLRVEENRLHLAPSWADPGPPRRATAAAFLQELQVVFERRDYRR